MASKAGTRFISKISMVERSKPEGTMEKELC